MIPMKTAKSAAAADSWKFAVCIACAVALLAAFLRLLHR